MRPIAATAASLPPATLRGGSLFLTALVGWSGFLVLTGHDPALAVGVRVAGVLTLLGMSVPGWLHEARVARAQRQGEWRRIRALVETRHLPVLARGDGARLQDTLSLSLLAVMELPLPIYEAAIGVLGRGEVDYSDSGRRAELSRRTVDDPRAEESSAMREHAGGDGGDDAEAGDQSPQYDGQEAVASEPGLDRAEPLGVRWRTSRTAR